MALNFPDSPTLNQTYTLGDRTWIYNGAGWELQTSKVGYTGSIGYTGSVGFTGSIGIQGFTGSIGITGFTGSRGFTGSIGFTGSRGPATAINATDDPTTATLYPVFVGAAGSEQTPKVTTTKLTWNANTGELSSPLLKSTVTNGTAPLSVASTTLVTNLNADLLDGQQGSYYTDIVSRLGYTPVNKAGDTMTGFLTLSADPTSALHAATKEYVDTVASASIHYHQPVRVESPTALNATYNNGTAGVGATLTNAGTQSALVIDGVTLALNDRVLVYNQTNAAHNGVYYVSNVGSGSTNWVLTRTTDTDSYGVSDPDALGTGDAFYVKEGTTGAGELYVMITAGTITFGTTNIVFSQISSAQIYSADGGLVLNGTQFSHADTSSVANLSSDNSGQTVLQDIAFTFDGYGHVTAASVATTTIPAINNGTLTLGVSGTGLSGSATFTANQSTGSTFTVTSNATANNTASTIVARDASGNFSAGQVTVTSVVVDGNSVSETATLVTSATTQVALATFAAASYGTAKFVVQATQGVERQSTEILVVHNGTTAVATEYAVLLTSTQLFSLEVDINSGNVRVLVTPTSATSTTFKTAYTLIGA